LPKADNGSPLSEAIDIPTSMHVNTHMHIHPFIHTRTFLCTLTNAYPGLLDHIHSHTHTAWADKDPQVPPKPMCAPTGMSVPIPLSRRSHRCVQAL
jgi:hypothetical protein